MLRPGNTGLADWCAIYRGAAVELDPVFQADVEAGAAALRTIRCRAGETNRSAKSGGAATAAEREEVLSLSRAGADTHPLPMSTVRLLAALKLAALGRGVLGVRWRLVEHIGECLSLGLLPPVPADADTERAMLARLAAGLLGEGELMRSGELLPAPEGLASAGLAPPDLAAMEAGALTSGTQVPTALALAGLFEAEQLLQTALVAAALSSAVLYPGEVLPPPLLARLSARDGAQAGAAALYALRRAGAEPVGPRAGIWPARALREARAIGACLDLLRHAGETLTAEANAVTEDRFVLWHTEEIVENPATEGHSVAVAADFIAMALARIGGLAERRIERIFESKLAQCGEGTGGAAVASLRPMAASLAKEVRERAFPSLLDDEPDAAGEPAASAALASARRLQPIAGNLTLILAVELMAAEACMAADQSDLSANLQRVRELLRARTARNGGDPLAAPQLAALAYLVRSGAAAAAAGAALPSVARAACSERGEGGSGWL